MQWYFLKFIESVITAILCSLRKNCGFLVHSVSSPNESVCLLVFLSCFLSFDHKHRMTRKMCEMKIHCFSFFFFIDLSWNDSYMNFNVNQRINAKFHQSQWLRSTACSMGIIMWTNYAMDKLLNKSSMTNFWDDCFNLKA